MATLPARRSKGQRRQLDSSDAGSPFGLLGVAPSTARILRYFALRPEARPHARHLQRVLELGGASLQRDLERLVTLGALKRFEDGRLVRYEIAPNAQLWTALRQLLGATSDATHLVRDALRDVSGVQAAFIFGSAAQMTGGDDSDVDVFVVEDPMVDRKALLRQLAEAGMLLGREVNAVRYTVQALAERLGDSGHAASRFVREVLAGPKQWVVGTAAVLLPLTTAAGLKMPNASAPA